MRMKLLILLLIILFNNIIINVNTLPTHNNNKNNNNKILAPSSPPPHNKNINNNNIISFLQLSDLHYDPMYKYAASTKTMCHIIPRVHMKRMDGSYSRLTSQLFGTHGERCDTSKLLMNATIISIKSLMKKSNEKIKFILVSGGWIRHDNDPHHHLTLNSTLTAINSISTLLRNNFKDILILPVIGNIDTYPKNKLSKNNSEYFTKLGNIWKPFLLSNYNTFVNNRGYYSKDIQSNLRVIILNTLFFSMKNNLVKDCKIQKSAGYIHLKWLQKQLEFANSKNISVILSGSLPPMNTTWYTSCYKQYQTIVNNYKLIIKAHIYGNRHMDEILPLLNLKNQSIGGILEASSIAPTYNPSYRLFHYKLSNPSVLLNYVQYIGELKNANHLGFMTFFKEYSTQKDYEMKDLSINSLKKFFQRLKNDKKLRKLYIKHQYIGTTPEIVYDNIKHNATSTSTSLSLPLNPSKNITNSSSVLVNHIVKHIPKHEHDEIHFALDGLRHRVKFN